MTAPPEPLLHASGLSKRYAAVPALREAELEILAGEVHALVGVNGAGKSTLVKILTGAVEPDAGSVRVAGREIALGDPRAPLAAGIACIYQESNLVPAMSVLDNVLLGRQPTGRLGVVDARAQRATVLELLGRYRLALDPDAPVGTLSTVQQKQVEIAKALSLGARVLLMDEPTAWLSQVEVEHLFEAVRALTASGAGVLYISHVLDEVFAIADRVTVMRDGAVLLTAATSRITKPELVQAMLGRELAEESEEERVPHEAGEPLLRCEGLGRAGAFEDVDLEVREGEIVCITGLIGAGRSEVLRAIFGADALERGRVTLRGEELRVRRPREAVRAGIGLVPEDRRRDGLLLSLSMKANLIAAHLPLVSRRGLLVDRLASRVATELVQKLGIVPPRIGLAVRKLSGGNQQKVLIGRWLAGAPRLLMLDEPTVGVDVGAKADIYRLLRRLADDGTAILMVSSDMEEVLTVPDRVVVMANGRVTATLPRREVTEQRVLAAASGEALPLP